MRVAAAGLVLLGIVRGAAGACSVTVSDGVWPTAAAHQAVAAGKFDGSVPLKGQGFNQSVQIKGFCDDKFTTSSSFACAAPPEVVSMISSFRASYKGTAPVSLNFGESTCPLKTISVYKTNQEAKPPFEMEMRLEFEPCQVEPAAAVGAAPATSAAVVVGIRKDPSADMNLLPWAKSVCSPATTTTLAPQTIVAKTTPTIGPVGEGKCDATAMKDKTGITKLVDCQQYCLGERSTGKITGAAECSGFSFNAAANGPNCLLYSTVPTKVEQPAAAGWHCYNLTGAGNPGVVKPTVATPAPPLEAAAQTLGIQEFLGQPSTAYLQHIEPPVAEPTCFKPMWWFTLQDRLGGVSSVPVKEADFDELLAFLPAPPVHTNKVSAPQVIDRVLVDTCIASGGWGNLKCPTPVIEKTDCRNEELTGAIISGVITSVLTWFFVAGWYFAYLSLFGKNAGYSQAPQEDGGSLGARVCTRSGFQAGMIAVAFGGAFFACWVSMQFLDAVMRSADCYDFGEFVIILLAVMLSVALAVVILSMYLATKHPGHHEQTLSKADPTRSSTQKLMLVEVQDGQDMAQPCADMMTATSEDGPNGPRFVAFTPTGSYNSMNASPPRL